MPGRLVRAVVTAGATLSVLAASPMAGTAPVRPVPLDGLVDCLGPVPDVLPGSEEEAALRWENAVCAEERHADQLDHPAHGLLPATEAGADGYRTPSLHDGRRFRVEVLDIAGMEAEVYLPCDRSCDRPVGVDAFEGPYPAVITYHGGASRKELHWWSSQVLAEAGYMVVAADSSGLSHTREEADAVVDWLLAGQGLAAEWDGATLGMAGHSAGGVMVSRLGQEHPAVDAVVSWDRAQSTVQPSDVPFHAPVLYLFADENCQQVPVCQPDPERSLPTERRGPGDKWHDFEIARAAGVDTMQLGLRASLHLDWVPSDLAGNRWAEPMTMYYTLAWFDRYLRGAADPALAQDAFDRLVADQFDDSFDRHALSQGIYDPQAQLAGAAGDPYAGNVPYTIAGLPVADRLSFLWSSRCWITSPDGAAPQRLASDDLRHEPCAEVGPRDQVQAPAADLG